MDTKHTPGPWVQDCGKIRGATMTANPYNIASINGSASREGIANARLIAAAPDLLAALEAIVQITDGSQPKDYPGALMVARAAIAAAKGEA